MASCAMAQTPLVVKSLGVDSTSMLSKRIVVWRVTADYKISKLKTVYTIQTLAPNGVVVNETAEKYLYDPFVYSTFSTTKLGVTIDSVLTYKLNH